MPSQPLMVSKSYKMLHQCVDGLFKHSKKKGVRRNQASVLQQTIIGTPTKIVAQESTIPTHATHGRRPFSTQQSLK